MAIMMRRCNTVVAVVLLWAGFWNLVDGFGLSGFAVRSERRLHPTLQASSQVPQSLGDAESDHEDDAPAPTKENVLTRRTAASQSVRNFFSLWTASASIFASSEWASAEGGDSPPKVVVLGGSGFVGSEIVRMLRAMGIPVVATSTNGRDGTTALDLTSSDAQSKLKGILQADGAATAAVVSCVGRIGTAEDEAVNAATGTAAMTAKAAGVERFVYITVSPEVKDFASDIDFLAGYMRGKTFSRHAILEQFGDKATLIEPTFIYGGGSFETNPPRVPVFYGQFIEGVLSASPVRQVERILSPGIMKIALEPPVAVRDVAQAAVAGALGKSPVSILDTYDKIKKAAALLE
jgi:NAD dependent epimerase/dehydratase family